MLTGFLSVPFFDPDHTVQHVSGQPHPAGQGPAHPGSRGVLGHRHRLVMDVWAAFPRAPAGPLGLLLRVVSVEEAVGPLTPQCSTALQTAGQRMCRLHQCQDQPSHSPAAAPRPGTQGLLASVAVAGSMAQGSLLTISVFSQAWSSLLIWAADGPWHPEAGLLLGCVFAARFLGC